MSSVTDEASLQDEGRLSSKDFEETDANKISIAVSPPRVKPATSRFKPKHSFRRTKFTDESAADVTATDSNSTISIDPITEPAVRVGLDELKYRFHRDLRALVPPLADATTDDKWISVNGLLLLMHNGIDEIERMLDDAKLRRLSRTTLFAYCDDDCTMTDFAAAGDDLSACARLPHQSSRPKPETGIQMKTYRIDNADGGGRENYEHNNKYGQ